MEKDGAGDDEGKSRKRVGSLTSDAPKAKAAKKKVSFFYSFFYKISIRLFPFNFYRQIVTRQQ